MVSISDPAVLCIGIMLMPENPDPAVLSIGIMLMPEDPDPAVSCISIIKILMIRNPIIGKVS